MELKFEVRKIYKILIFVWTLGLSQLAQSFCFLFCVGPSDSSPVLLQMNTQDGRILSGGINNTQRIVENFVSKNIDFITKNGLLNQLSQKPPISIYETQTAGSLDQFIGTMFPISVENETVYILAKHVLNDLLDIERDRLLLAPDLNLNLFQVAEFKLPNENYSADFSILIPISFFESQACIIKESLSSRVRELNSCFAKIKNTILDYFAYPQKDHFWISLLPESKVDGGIEWKFSFGSINSINPSEIKIIKTKSEYPVISLINNYSNFTRPGVSGSIIRKLDGNLDRLGNPVGLIICRNENYTFALDIKSILENENLEISITPIENKQNDWKNVHYNTISQIDCKPVDGRNGGGY